VFIIDVHRVFLQLFIRALDDVFANLDPRVMYVCNPGLDRREGWPSRSTPSGSSATRKLKPEIRPIDGGRYAVPSRSESEAIARAGPSYNYDVELLYQRRTRRARSVFQRLALPTPVSISNGICSG
jgi:hypothetical protein